MFKKSMGLAVIVSVIFAAPALAQVRDADYRGTLVCGKLPFAQDPARTAITVQITGNYQSGADRLAAAPQFGVTPSFDGTTGTLTLTGTTSLANYQTILRSVTYENTSDAPSTLPRTVSFRVSDGAAASAAATRDIDVTAVDDAPVLTTSAGSTAYTEQDPATVIDSALAITDPDGGADPTGATVKIVSPASGVSAVSVATCFFAASMAAWYFGVSILPGMLLRPK